MYPPTLRWLARARSQGLRRQFYIVASPDPRICAGLTPLEKQYNHYMLRFGSGCWPGTDRYDSINPTYAHAYNYSPTSLPLQTDYFKHSESDWVYLVDTGLKSRDGKTARKVLLDIIKAFPEYDLKSDEGIDKAIEKMVTKLGEVVSFRESRDVEKKSTA